MKYAIIEDNLFAAKHLEMAINKLRPDWQKAYSQTMVSKTIDYLQTNPDIDLIFMDIELSDGRCFDVFDAVQTIIPIIFTTAYDDFALRAIKVNCVDYLLKPVTPAALSHAIDKFEHLYVTHKQENTPSEQLPPEKVVNRILTISGDKYNYINIEDISHFLSEDDYVFAYLHDKPNRCLINIPTLTELEQVLPPTEFFRLSRNLIASIKSINSVSKYLRGRLLVKLSCGSGIQEFVVPVSRRDAFLRWLGR